MRIKLLISVAAATFSHVPGDIVDWPEDAALAYIAEGYATTVPESPAPDNAPSDIPATVPAAAPAQKGTKKP